MKRLTCSIVALSCALSVGPAPAADEATLQVAPGQVTALDSPRLEHPIRVFVPSNYDASRPWPVIVYFHGTNGAPTTDRITPITEGRDFIVVGMAYLERGVLTDGQAAALREWANTKRVIRHISRDLSIDADRIYIAGFSKGGWVSSLIFEARPDEVAGAIVLGAGLGARIKIESRTSTDPKPLYIGIGALERNCAAARAGAAHFARLNAQVTFDEYPDTGHAIVYTQQFTDWVRAETLRPDAEMLRAEASAKTDAIVATVAGDPIPFAAYLALQQFKAGPWYHAADHESRRLLNDQIMRAGKEKEGGRDPWLAERAYQRIVKRESADRIRGPITEPTIEQARLKRRAQLVERRDAFTDVANRYPDTHFGRKALEDVERLTKVIQFVDADR